MSQTYPAFNKEQLKQANDWAISMNYNRALEPEPLNEYLKTVDENTLFPVVFTMLHEHAAGKQVDPHMRCKVVLNAKGGTAFIDTDLDLYNNLEIVSD
jgi:hypothetical protein